MRTNSSLLLIAVVCMVVLMHALFQVSARATTIRLLSIEKLTETSSDVVQGKVTKIESFWNKKRTAIYTRVTVTRRNVLKGNVPRKVAVFLPGGTIGGKTTMVIGAPEFMLGQEVVLFLSRATNYQEELELPPAVVPFHLTDLFQGKFDVMIDPATGRRKAVSNAIKLFEQQEVKPEMLPPGGLKGFPLTDLINRIRQVR